LKPRFCFDVCWDAYRAARADIDEKGGLSAIDTSDLRGDGNWRPRVLPVLQDFCADFELAGRRALAAPHFASRLILFRVYYLGLAPYENARHFLGIGELTWVAWTEQIRTLVGHELDRTGIFPVRKYFREPFFRKHFTSLQEFNTSPGAGCVESHP
jgi:hypothetical protein